VKIRVNQIPQEGIIIEENISPAALELENEGIKVPGPVRIRAEVSKITSVVTIDLLIELQIFAVCSRCLVDSEINLSKKVKLNYQVSASEQTLDIDPDIREEIILEYPIKPLCKIDCKGLCPKCGQNFNEGGCSCGVT
jgi:uncharacterized protein